MEVREGGPRWRFSSRRSKEVSKYRSVYIDRQQTDNRQIDNRQTNRHLPMTQAARRSAREVHDGKVPIKVSE